MWTGLNLHETHSDLFYWSAHFTRPKLQTRCMHASYRVVFPNHYRRFEGGGILEMLTFYWMDASTLVPRRPFITRAATAAYPEAICESHRAVAITCETLHHLRSQP